MKLPEIGLAVACHYNIKGNASICESYVNLLRAVSLTEILKATILPFQREMAIMLKSPNQFASVNCMFQELLIDTIWPAFYPCVREVFDEAFNKSTFWTSLF